MNRIFQGFPSASKCPLCGKGTDTPCILVPIEGTANGNNEEAIPVHVTCMEDSRWRYLPHLGVIYTLTSGEADENNQLRED